MARAILDWIAIALYTVAFGVPATLVSLVRPQVVLRWFVRPWTKLILWTCGVRVETEGLDNLPEGPCVIMFNHQSYFDIFAFASVLPGQWRAVMKRELGRIPFFGWVARATGHHLIRREASVKAMREMDKIAAAVKAGTPVLIAPEGTRSRTGELGQFRPGGFVLALRAGVPVVPMVILGGKDVMAADSLLIRPGRMKVVVTQPVDVSGYPAGRQGRERLMAEVRRRMEEVLRRERSPAPRREGGAQVA